MNIGMDTQAYDEIKIHINIQIIKH